MTKIRTDLIRGISATMHFRIFLFTSAVKNIELEVLKTILLVTLYTGETLFLALKEEQILRILRTEF